MKLPKEMQKNPKKTGTGKTPLNGIDINKIKDDFSLDQIIDRANGKPIPCPKCSKNDFLRGWEIQGNMYALCYFCGSIFFMETGEILYTCEGDRISWGATALAIIGSKEH